MTSYLATATPAARTPPSAAWQGSRPGLPIEVPGYQLDRRCSSGLQAILNASMLVQTENADVVIAGGVEEHERRGILQQ